MDAKMKELLSDGSIREVNKPHPKGWVSNIFLVPKKDSGFHMILNLKPLNSKIQYQKFKMDYIEQVITLLHPGLVLTSLDI